MTAKPKSKKHIVTVGILKPGVRVLILMLTLAATGLAGYLAWISFSGRNVVGCGPESGCAAVLNSRWAYWLGIPVSVFGGLTYLAAFMGTLRLTPAVSAAQQRKAWIFLVLMSWLIVGAVLWFVVLQVVVIKQFCPFCMSAHGTALIAAILLLRHCPYGHAPKREQENEHVVYVTPPTIRRLFAPAAAGLGLLAAGQMVAPKKTFETHEHAGIVQITTNAVTTRTNNASAHSPAPAPTNASSSTAQVQPAEFRSISLFDGQLQFDLVDVPMIGRPDAPHVIIGLHDYTCKGCRAMHKPLMNIFHKYSNDLVIVSLPLPLDADCNPIVPKTPPAHVNACQYAKISLAVWRAKPEALTEFDDWVFAPERPPSVEETREFARALVGDDAFAVAWNDPLVDRQLKIDIALYGLNYQMNKRSSMPQLFVGQSVLFGSMPEEELEQKIVREFGLTPPP